LNHPNVDAEHPFALDYQTIATAQGHDPELQQVFANKPQHFARIAMSNDVNVICYITEPNTPWRICLPLQPAALNRSNAVICSIPLDGITFRSTTLV
jgi:hypothetical protein